MQLPLSVERFLIVQAAGVALALAYFCPSTLLDAFLLVVVTVGCITIAHDIVCILLGKSVIGEIYRSPDPDPRRNKTPRVPRTRR